MLSVIVSEDYEKYEYDEMKFINYVRLLYYQKHNQR